MQRKFKRAAARASDSVRAARTGSAVDGEAPSHAGVPFNGRSDPGFDLDNLFNELAVHVIEAMLDLPPPLPPEEQAKRTGRPK